jgi:hypothetical protein
MARAPLTITVDSTSELARALADADTLVVLDSNGVRYTIVREEEFVPPDPETILRKLRKSRGALKGVDIATLLADLDAQRSQDPTRGSV